MNELNRYRKIHFIGIGGVGMSAIASVLLSKGFHVSGSDASENEVTRRLTKAGARVFQGHRAENIEGAELVVTSTAIRRDNPERMAAEIAAVPIWRRAKVLAEIMRGGKGLAVSGTHGKTTTTSMAAIALTEAGLDPSALIGGDVPLFGSNARTGSGEWVVAEADESDASMLEMDPDRVIVTNIEADHLDYYRDLDHILETFATFLRRMRPEGKVIAGIDCPSVRKLLAMDRFPALTYSLRNSKADIYARDVRHLVQGGALRFTAVYQGKPLGTVRLQIPGLHNVSNALAVILTGLDLGCDFESLARGLGRYTGAKRRFQLKGESQGVTIVDDYAHHPTEIRATLAAARAAIKKQKQSRRIVGIFQPHRYSRTQSLATEFGQSFGDADVIVVTDVYSAGEDPIEGVSGSSIFKHVITSGHPDAYYIPKQIDVLEFLRPRLREGDMLFTLGAGDVWRLGENILTDLRERETARIINNGTAAQATLAAS